ncbi:MAG: hypothetical protein CML68_22960 [Rhodobacteraceae bacterium]|nr:hypothetical protein [Paracoccaceae bacterium]
MSRPVSDSISPTLFRAFLILGLVGAGAAAWLSFAPISGAVIAEGRFKVDGDVKTVQHLEGGIVTDLLVRDGDRVRRGDPLLKLDASETQATLAALVAERDALLARQVRLEAERDGLAAPAFETLGGADRATLASAVQSQLVLFEARQSELDAQMELTEGTIARLAARLSVHRAELASIEAQLPLAEQNAQNARALSERGNITQRDLNAREREYLSLTGGRDSLLASIAETEASQAEARLTHGRARTEYLSAVATELSEVVAALAEITPRIDAERRRLDRALITAPVDGVVFGLQLATVGGVIAPGAEILELVPASSDLVVEARLAPAAREQVREGMPVQLRLPGIRSRQDAPLEGRIDLISAELTQDMSDTDQDERTYAVQIALADLPADLSLEPGMPVTSVIATRNRTALNYLVSPLSDAMARSMREQ